MAPLLPTYHKSKPGKRQKNVSRGIFVGFGVMLLVLCVAFASLVFFSRVERKQNEDEMSALEADGGFLPKRFKRNAAEVEVHPSGSPMMKEKKRKARAKPKKERKGRRRNKRQMSAMFHVGARDPSGSRSAVLYNQPYIANWDAEIMEGFTLERGSCARVPYDGIYKIYSQVMFNMRRGFEIGTGLYTVAGDGETTTPHAICKFSFPKVRDRDEQVTCRLERLVRLNSGDCLQIKLLPPNVAVYLRQTMTYFGGHLILAT